MHAEIKEMTFVCSMVIPLKWRIGDKAVKRLLALVAATLFACHNAIGRGNTVESRGVGDTGHDIAERPSRL